MEFKNLTEFLLWMFGPINAIFITFFVMLSIGIITSILVLLVKGSKTKNKAKFIIKEVFVIFVLALACALDKLIVLPAGKIKTVVALFYIYQQGLTILRNAQTMGLPLPKVIKDAVKLLGAKTNNEESEKKV